MNKPCPHCGADMRSETGGWRCPICGIYVDARGAVHPWPYRPPTTNGDRFRAKTDEELAEFLSRVIPVIECPEEVWKAQESGMKYAEAWLKWLQLPAKEN